jgi:hypothetical protein
MDGFKLCGLIVGGIILVQKVICDGEIFLLNFDQYRKQSRDAESAWYRFVMEVLEGQRNGNPYDTFCPYIKLKNGTVFGGLYSPERNELINEVLLSDAICDDNQLYLSLLNYL